MAEQPVRTVMVAPPYTPRERKPMALKGTDITYDDFLAVAKLQGVVGTDLEAAFKALHLMPYTLVSFKAGDMACRENPRRFRLSATGRGGRSTTLLMGEGAVVDEGKRVGDVFDFFCEQQDLSKGSEPFFYHAACHVVAVRIEPTVAFVADRMTILDSYRR